METMESQKAASHSSHSPLEISPTAGEIPTFPQPSEARMEKWKPKPGFPLSHARLATMTLVDIKKGTFLMG
jgi:hypothetical protein